MYIKNLVSLSKKKINEQKNNSKKKRNKNK